MRHAHFVLAVLLFAGCGPARTTTSTSMLPVDTTWTWQSDDVERHHAETWRSVSGSTTLTIQFRNVCTTNERLSVFGEPLGQSCNDTAYGEAVLIPEDASLVRGSSAVLDDESGSVGVAFADSTRTLVFALPAGTYDLTGGHLAAMRIDVAGLVVSEGDSVVVTMEKSFVPLPHCHSALPDATSPHPLVAYLLMPKDRQYGIMGGQLRRACIAGVERFMREQPSSHR